MKNPPEIIEMTTYVKRGKFIVRRDALHPSDPDHPYNWIKAQGLSPEDYGIEKPDYVPEAF